MIKEKDKKIIITRIMPTFYLVFSVIALLSVIPVNLNMRRYGFEYDLVPFATSIFCCILPLLISFPFFNYSRQRMNNSLNRYRFITTKSYTHISFIILIVLSLSLVLRFNFLSSSLPYAIKYPFILSCIALPLSYITTISTLIVIETLSLPENAEKKTATGYKIAFSWVMFSVIILSAASLFCIYLSYIVVGVSGFIYLCIFVIALINFLKREKEKKTIESDSVSKPISSLILLIVYSLITLVYYALMILLIVFLVKGYLIINFSEFYSGFFLAIQGSYVLFLIVFYSVIYWMMIKKKMFD